MQPLVGLRHRPLGWLIMLLILADKSDIISAKFFTHYRKYHNVSVVAHHLPTFQVGDAYSINGKFREPQIECGVSCNINPDCSAFSLDANNSCVLLNDLISLIYTRVSIRSTLFSKKKLFTCISDYYADFSLMQCFAKFSHGVSCSTLNQSQCSDVVRGLECLDEDFDDAGVCQCRNPGLM